MAQIRIAIPTDAITQFCRRWQIRALALFGSVLRADVRPDSDVDVLVVFDDAATWGLLDHVQLQQELEALLQHPVDLISRRALEQSANAIRRETILSTAQVIYRAE